jgi:hypothetical protein
MRTSFLLTLFAVGVCAAPQIFAAESRPVADKSPSAAVRRRPAPARARPRLPGRQLGRGRRLGDHRARERHLRSVLSQRELLRRSRLPADRRPHRLPK